LKRYGVRFLAGAVDDLGALFFYIAQRSSFEIADGYLARIERTCLSLQSLPMRGAAVPGDMKGLRKMGFERRVTILLSVGDERVENLRILYGGRDVNSNLERL
jgi:toxin ParE1/3/4